MAVSCKLNREDRDAVNVGIGVRRRQMAEKSACMGVGSPVSFTRLIFGGKRAILKKISRTDNRIKKKSKLVVKGLWGSFVDDPRRTQKANWNAHKSSYAHSQRGKKPSRKWVVGNRVKILGKGGKA